MSDVGIEPAGVAADRVGCDVCARPLRASSSRLCGSCVRDARRAVGELSALYRACEPTPAAAGWNPYGKISSSRRVDLPLNETAMAVRADILTLLASWAGLVAMERGLGPEQRPARNVDALCAFLGHQVTWLAAHPAAADFVEETARLAQRARSCATRDGQARIEIGRCVVSGCDAPVHALTNADAAATGTSVSCAAGHRWPPSHWILLAKRLRVRQAAPPVS